MTTVHISLGRDDGTDQTAAKGVVEWEPTTRREDGTMVILERGFVAPLVDGEATVIVDPSGLTWCWRVTERTDSGGTVRYVAVPDSATTVEYVDLPDVDPDTLVAWSPADPEAAYQTALDAIGGGAGTVTSVDGIKPDESGNVSLSSTYATKDELAAVDGTAITVSETQPDFGFWLVAAPAVPADTTNPAWTATFTMGTPTETSVVATASALATDNVAVTGYEVSYDDGSTYAAITPSGSNFTLSGSAGITYATTKLRAKDAAGNASTALSVPSYTMAASTDTTNPTPGTLASSSITDTTFTLTVSGASDETALNTTPYSFSTDGGTTWTAYQASASLDVTGKTAETSYTCQHRVKDAAGNISTGTAITVTTEATATATSFFTDFSEYTTDTAPSDWTSRWKAPTSFTVVADAAATGGKVLRIVQTTMQRTFLSWDAVPPAADVEIVARFRTSVAPTDATEAQMHVLKVRAGGAAASESSYNGNVAKRILITKYVAGSAAPLAAGGDVNVLANAWWWIRLRANGSSVYGRLWREGSAEPSTWFSNTDSSLSSGLVGVGMWAAFTVDFDVIGVHTNGGTAPTSA